MTYPRKLKRDRSQIQKSDDGHYQIVPPKLRGLVLSGGGAKGVAYAGMIDSLVKSDVLTDIAYVSGSSAGAITACLLAIGLSSTQLKDFTQNLNAMNLLDRHSLGRAKGDRLQNIIELLLYVQLKEYLEQIEKPIATENQVAYRTLRLKLENYKWVLKGQDIENIQSVSAILNNREKLKIVDKAFKTLPRVLEALVSGKSDKTTGKPIELENPRMTFNDFAQLRKLLPIEKRSCLKHLSVTNTNQTKGTLEIYNAQKTPVESIAEKVRRSAAHPFIFTPERSKQGDYYADGGILDNMPADLMQDYELDQEEVLCVKLLSDIELEKRLTEAQNPQIKQLGSVSKHADMLIKPVIGGQWFHAKNDTINREKVFYALNNMLYLNSGTVTTTSMSITDEQKQVAFENGCTQTNEILARRTLSFDDPLLACLYLGETAMRKRLKDCKPDDKLTKAIKDATTIFNTQNNLLDYVKNNQSTDVLLAYNTLEANIEQAYKNSQDDNPLLEQQKEKALALCVKQINFMSEGAFIKLLDRQLETAKPESKIFKQIYKILCFLYKPLSLILPFNSNADMSNHVDYSLYSQSQYQYSHVFFKPAKATDSSNPENQETSSPDNKHSLEK